MHHNRWSFAVGIAALAGVASPSAADWWWPPTSQMVISPVCASPTTPVYIGLSGIWPDVCIPNAFSVVRNGTDIDIKLWTAAAPTCNSALTPWVVITSCGPMPADRYAVWATYYRGGVPITARALLGTFFVSDTCAGGCYANCDGSSTTPLVNTGDFTCFIQKFASGDLAANCDGSSMAPVLNVGDFTCFLQRYSAGCS
jgi:hypothetical protein